MVFQKIASTLTLSLLFGHCAYAEQATVLLQAGAPLEIVSYTNRYKAPDRVGDGSVIHRATVQNVSDQPVASYGLGFYIFDSFKRDMGRPFLGYAMNNIILNASDSPGWEQRPSSAFLFERNGHGLAYVAIARLEDGTIWKADLDDIARQLEDFELELSAEGKVTE